MVYKHVLFDLDGTLLPLNQDVFLNTYFKKLTESMSCHGYNQEELFKVIWLSVKEMLNNDGTKTNCEAYWDKFASVYGQKAYDDIPLFDEFYRLHFDEIKEVSTANPLVKECIELLINSGIKPILATSPVFPAIAVEKRIAWAGLKPEDFVYYTHYENCTYCKPNVKYYAEIAEKLDLNPAQCLMVGNDVDEDMVAKETGMDVFLITDCLINKRDVDISNFKHGGFAELIEFLKNNIDN